MCACTTPLGQQSECVTLYKCPQLLSAFSSQTVPAYIVTFLRQSSCGFEGSVPKVCCGPLPRPPDQPVVGGVDPVSSDDSVPSPRGTCGKSSSDKLYGGTNTELDEYPWMVLLGYRTRNGTITYQCGGVLINHRYVLTAAHCVTGAIEQAVGTLATARLGEYDQRTNPDCVDGNCADPYVEIPVDVAFAHTGYNDGNKNRKDDIAVVRLAKRAKFSYFIGSICLVQNDGRLTAGNAVYVAGWGKTLNGRNSPVKQKLGLPIFDKNECKDKYRRSFNAELVESQLCAGGQFAEDACQGDSGGPLMKMKSDGSWEVVAVVSFGYGCGRDGWPGVYTSVAHYIDWIESTIRSSNV